MADISIDPPNSRLFILCGKTVTEDDLHDAFDKYGHIEDIWIVKDKATNESKGYILFGSYFYFVFFSESLMLF